jgi:hypothetical protein
MNNEVAKKLNTQLREVMGSLEDSLWFVKENCTEEEYQAYKRAIGRVMGSIVIEIFNPLYVLHPEIDPDPSEGSV